MDATLVEAVDVARAAIAESTPADHIGEHLGFVADDERVITHRFASHVPGYRGWELFATLARAPRAKVATVCESGMLPGDDAILAPKWVPWMERASEEERVRLDAIAAGEDPAKALEAAGFGPAEEPAEEPQAAEPAQPVDADERKKARREAKRRRAKQKGARDKKSAQQKAAKQ